MKKISMEIDFTFSDTNGQTVEGNEVVNIESLEMDELAVAFIEHKADAIKRFFAYDGRLFAESHTEKSQEGALEAMYLLIKNSISTQTTNGFTKSLDEALNELKASAQKSSFSGTRFYFNLVSLFMSIHQATTRAGAGLE